MAALINLACFVLLTGPSPTPRHETLLYRVAQIRVLRRIDSVKGSPRPEHVLMRGDTHRGLQFERPGERRLQGDPREDLSRLPTTYHHQRSPVGVVMEKLDWFPGPDNTYYYDARMPASVVGIGPDPMSQLLNLWSEPPYGVIGMYVGGMAAYARPFQFVDFYESDPDIIKLSLPGKGGKHYFRYIQDARARGAFLRVFQGDERLALNGKGPERFYHVLALEICPRDLLEDISVNLLTREGMALCMDRLAEEGILCIHTSNRYIDVVPAVADVAASLGLATLRGSDRHFDPADHSAFTSEWVMVARRPEYLRLRAPAGYDETQYGPFWSVPTVTARHVWRDGAPNSRLGLMRDLPLMSRLRMALSYQLPAHFRARRDWLAHLLSGEAGRRASKR